MTEAVSARENRNDLLTHEECEQILKNLLDSGKTGKLLDFSIVPELSSIGYLGEYYHLKLKYHIEKDKDVHETRFFIKSMPYSNAEMCNHIEMFGILKKEITLYGKLLNKLSKLSKTRWCAQCYLSRKDLFVMQNILDLGYEPMAESTGFLKENQIKPLLKGLATLHACSIAYEEKNHVVIGEELKDVLFEATVLPTIAWYTSGIKAVIAVALVHPSFQSDVLQNFIKHKLSRQLDCVYDMVNTSSKYRNVFCHRDPWGGNVFFNKKTPSETAAVFVDFQLCRYSPPAIDVLFAIYLNIRPKERVPLEDQYYRWYYECFSKELKEMGLSADEQISWSQFTDSLKELQLFGVVYNSIAATILRVPDDYLKNMKETRPEDFHRYTNIGRTEEVLKLVSSHNEFREYMYECIEDMMRVVLKSNSKELNSFNV